MPHLTWLPAEQEPKFPDTRLALDEPEGLLAVGGALTEKWLVSAYQKGIFPWYSEGEPIMWWSPAPRMVLTPGSARVNRTLKKHFKRHEIEIRINEQFERVIEFCSDEALRKDGTWITDDMKAAYIALHRAGWAHSIEVHYQGELAGGLYGVGIGPVFYGESMFSLKPNASKYAFIVLSELANVLHLKLIDCQLYNDYLASLGASLVSRAEFESELPSSKNKLSLDYAEDPTSLLRARFQSPNE